MTRVDLITGFLGAGKTTFILDYARELIRRGERIGIIENDYGAINVDLMLLSRSLGEQGEDNCRLEMVIGGDPDCHRRRLKTKLIAMGIDRFDRVLVEPSGVFDVEEFTDILYEEPLEHMMSLENVITVVDPGQLLKENRESGSDRGLSPDARYILGEQLSKAGCVFFSKAENYGEAETEEALRLLNGILQEVQCGRVLTEGDILRRGASLGKDHTAGSGASTTEGRDPGSGASPAGLTGEDWDRILHAGNRDYAYAKRQVVEDGSFTSLFFFYPELQEKEEEAILRRMEEIFRDPALSGLSRIKGFLEDDGEWIEINATRERTEIRKSPVGQPVLIAIGQGITQEAVGHFLKSYENEYRG